MHGFKHMYNPNECWALRRGKIHMVKDREHDLYCEHVDTSLTGGYFCIPLIAPNKIMGVLNLYNNSNKTSDIEQKTFEYKSRLAMSLADYASLSISSLKLQEKLHKRSIHDPLTGLYNRWYMDKASEREISRAVNLVRPLGVILMDIDHFKKFNDTYGHKAGDKVLSEIAKLLNKHIRQEDIACRYGGEEFLFILPGSTLEATKQRAEDLREEAKGLRIKYSDLVLDPITLSLGVAALPDHGSTPDTLIESADQALYTAKDEGRDRVVVKLTDIINVVTPNNLEQQH
jgi:diguanylate cyclase (GGDEF)-like protein